MTVKEFNNLKEIQKYYNKETNTYVFKENEEYIDLVVFNFDLNVEADIIACDISAWNIRVCDISACNISVYDINACDIIANDIKADNINARNIGADDINAWNISACNISADNINYYAVCFAYNNIFCKSINGRRENAKHFVLDGILEVEE